MEAFEARYAELMTSAAQADAARALGPIQERSVFGRHIFLFDGVDRARLAQLGEVRTPGLADLFIAMMAPSQGVAE
jgi:ABC-2 type transport system ATP-binding protein